MDQRKIVNASFDGACEPWNPGGHMGLGWVIDGIEHYEYVAAGLGNTNNVAEYRALICLLEAVILSPEPGKLQITGDSQLTVNQVLGEWGCHQQQLANLRDKVKGLLDRLKRAGWDVSLSWVGREFNTEADRASKAALLEHGIEPAMRDPVVGFTQRLGDVAKQFEISAVALGKVLDIIGIRDTNKEPTQKAISDGCALRRFDGRGLRADWHIEKIAKLVRDHFLATGFTPRGKREPVPADHLCGHTVRLGVRPSRKQLEEVRETLCADCQRGNTSLYKDERAEVLLLCTNGESLVDAVELSVANRRLRPAVYMAAWGKWSHERRETLLRPYRDQCEKPGLHPEFLAESQKLDDQKTRDLERLIRAAVRAD